MKSLLNKTNTLSAQSLESLFVFGKQNGSIDNSGSRNKVFSAADLWNIQRQGKNRSSRRFI